jgi:RNA polymerase sigma factor (sigma-70 family)
MSALLQAPHSERDPDGEVSDQVLVAALRRGDDRAFETLYERYHRRIHAYVFGMVKDHQRAEDVTQEVFVSALRRMRATERPIAFKPWIYEIAKNACIDQFRRSKRAEEVSFDAEDGLAPSDYGRLVSPEPVPDAALVAKQQIDDLCGAFGGLSEAHHQILVLRELEGLSYREIGEKMGMSRPAVESTLFRARRRLTEEYDELASGERCQRVQSIIANAGRGRLGARDTRRLARHVAHCQPCRRQAVEAGVDSALVASVPRRRAERIAAVFPFPLFFRGRRGLGGGSGNDLGAGWLNQLPMVSDHASAGTAKIAAAAAVLVAGLGAGVGMQVGSPERAGGGAAKLGEPAGARKAAEQPAGATNIVRPTFGTTGSAADRRRRREAARSTRDPARRRGDHRAGSKAGAGTPAAERRESAAGTAPAGDGGGAGGGGSTDRSGGSGGSGGASGSNGTAGTDGGQGGAAPGPVSGGGGGGASTPPVDPAGGGGGGGGPSAQLPAVPLPKVTVPQGTLEPQQTVDDTVGSAQDTTDGITDAVDEATSGATAPVTGPVDQVTDSVPDGLLP